ncbi:MAG: molecular chaperone DnaK [Armatimonadota bacterium]|jgi:molecular chaperone DnaK
MGKVIGIDLGTTNSVVAVVQAGDPVVITNREGSRITPSVVHFGKDGQRLVGVQARRQAVLSPERTVTSIKRKMGSRDKTTIDGKDYSPEEISGMIVRKLKEEAEAFLGEEVTDAVITVPAYFDDSQRTATKNAGEIAGLNVRRIINEPTAASLAYGLGEVKKEATILVFDLGGGTFDVSIMDVEISPEKQDDRDYYEVLATSGDTQLGGDDFDERIVEHVAEQFMKDTGIDLRKDRQALQRLREAAEKAKCELSTTVQTQISLPFITSVDGEGPKHLDTTLTRAKLEELIGDLIEKTAESVERAMKDAKLTQDGIHEVILVGGSTRIPAVQELVTRLTGKEPRKGVNPDEVVAVGAAIQAAVLGDEMRDMVLLDVTPLTLGIETLGGVTTKLIERNTTIPTRASEVFSTASDFQTTVEVHVLQGEREMAGDNKSLGKFHLTGIPPAPRGVPQIEVSFDIDANGIVNVSAQDKATNKEQSITITASGQLDKDEIDRMVSDAEAHAADDQKRRETAEAKNEADTVAYQLEKTLNDLGDKVTDDEKKPVRDKIAELREAAKGDDVEKTREAMRAAQEAFAPLASKAYEAATAEEGAAEEAAQAEGTTGQATSQPADDDVIDAEFTAEDEK